MELTESIATLNNQLIDLYGIDTITGIPMWRISWSEDQFEKRRMETTPAGVQLLYPQVFEVPKYSYIKNKYVLERLVVIPPNNTDELPAAKLSYEPIWVYQNNEGGYLPPVLHATKFIIDSVYAAIRQDGSMAKYKESADSLSEEGKEARIDSLRDELFGNETDAGDALAYHEGIVVPRNYEKKGN